MKSSGKKYFSSKVAKEPGVFDLYSMLLRSFSGIRSASGMSVNRCIGIGRRCGAVCTGGGVGCGEVNAGAGCVVEVVGVMGISGRSCRGGSVGVLGVGGADSLIGVDGCWCCCF